MFLMIVTPELQPKWNAIIVDVLRKFIEICKQHNLTYYCCGGTAIGAIRHGGMIPWDDDIDVFMPRPDYDRFVDIIQNTDLGNYEYVSPFTHDNYPLYFIKLCNRKTTLMEEHDTPCVYGLYIDVFPIDGAPDDYDEAKAMERRFTKIKNKLEAISTHNTFAEYIKLLCNHKEWGRFVRKTIGFFFRKKYRNHLLCQLDSICRSFPFDYSNLVAVYCGSYGPKEVFPRKWLENTVKFSFEGLTVNLPSGYDSYLRQYYGDYMQLPPEEKRISHHTKAFFNFEERLPDKEVFRIICRNNYS